MKKQMVVMGLTLAMTVSLAGNVLAVGNRYEPDDLKYFSSDYGQNLGIRTVSQVADDGTVTIVEGKSDVENADLSGYLTEKFGEGFDWEQIKADYVGEGVYVISGSRVLDWEKYADLQPGQMGDDTTEHPVEIGGRLYVHVKDPSSAQKYYLLVSSTKDVAIGEALYTDGEGGYGLLDDKYVSTHMATSQPDGGNYSYFAHDLGASGGKIGLQEAGSEGQKYIYVICETPADYYQRLANEEAGFETRLEGQDRPYMPANNTAATDGTWLNEWHNTGYGVSIPFTNTAAEGEEAVYVMGETYGLDVKEEELVEKIARNRDGSFSAPVPMEELPAELTIPVKALYRDSSVNDGVIRTGGTEGDSNTRLGGYSGENVVVAKFEVTVSAGKALIAYATNEEVYGDAGTEGSGQVLTSYFENAQYASDGEKGELTIAQGEPWYFHTQIADCSGRGGFI
ncbi:MAG: hypothetical protein IIZ39_12315, partial [Blautia sp.]|nr:hypothetical protein [Blautia sp.]